MIWPPDACQYYGHEKYAYSHSWIHCHGGKVRRWLRDTAVGRPLTVSAPALFSEGLMALNEELVSHVPPSVVIASNLFENILHELARRLAGDSGVDVIEGRLLAVCRWIGTAPRQKVTLGQLARMAGMSAPHFSASLKKAFGQSAITCLIVQRLTHAAHLLADRNQNIGSIAERVGYDDPFHFSKAFNRHFGQSPRELRRQRHGW